MTAAAQPRVPKYTEDDKFAILERICMKVAEGGVENTFKAAAAAEGVARSTLFKWTTENRKLGQLWQNARIWQAHSTSEDAIELADGATPENVHVRRLQVDTRKWYVSKIASRYYGDKLELSAPGGQPLIPASTTRTDLSKLSTEQLETYAALTAIATVVVEQRADLANEENAEADADGR